MDVIIESHIPFIAGELERRNHRVIYLPPEEITAQTVKNADALIIRTRTRADHALLHGSRVRHVATATIGTDHIDMTYCRNNGIAVSNAPGCNAPAVAQYVISSLAAIVGPERLPGMTLGIVGVGNVGRTVERWARGIGMNLMLCDPPRAKAEGIGNFVSINDIAECADAITFHTPLDRTTRHLCDWRLLSACRRQPVVINAARGSVADNGALIAALHDRRIRAVAIDCWEGEPAIDPILLSLSAVATPHIAGYSIEGKMRASAMAAKAIDPEINMSIPPAAISPALDAILASYSPAADTMALRAAPQNFEALRNNYNYRNEPN